MDKKHLQQYCGSKKGVSVEYPFGPDVTVYKVMGKMFALIPVGDDVSISLKCDPMWAQILRQTYTAIAPGYHLNKQHWNTITIDGSISDEEIYDMIDHSYEQVVKSLKKSDKEKLDAL